jgi:hypothetical protein
MTSDSVSFAKTLLGRVISCPRLGGFYDRSERVAA